MLKRFGVLTFIVSSALCGGALAQDFPAGIPSNVDMQQMMRSAQSMASCMSNIDQAKLQSLSQEAESVVQQIDDLCAQDKAEEALQVAIDFSRKINDDPVVQEMRSCSAEMEQMVDGLVPQAYADAAIDAGTEAAKSICAG